MGRGQWWRQHKDAVYLGLVGFGLSAAVQVIALLLR